MNVLATTWFVLIGLMFTTYAVLDGFDLGVGILSLFAPKHERRILRQAIAPFWDGNEVWLLAGGASLFAAFPPAYAAVFSGFYLPVMGVVFALILRAVSLEFSEAVPGRVWRVFWDIGLFIGSIVPPLVFGVAVGNLLKGVPLNTSGFYAGTLAGLFSHYTVAAGLLAVMMFATQGALWLALKTGGVLRRKATGWAFYTSLVYLVLFIDLTVWSVLISPHISINFRIHPYLFLVPLSGFATLAAIPFLAVKRRAGVGFAASTLSIVIMMATFGISVFPNLVFQLGHYGKSLKITNAASSEKTLFIMLVLAAIGLPLVLISTVYLYRVFRGKVGKD